MTETADPEVEVVARLTSAELREVRLVQAAVESVAVQHRLVQAGARDLWGMINRKYHLPPDVQFDPTSGYLFRRATMGGASTNGHVAEEPVGPEQELVLVESSMAPASPAPPQHRQPKARKRKKGK